MMITAKSVTNVKYASEDKMMYEADIEWSHIEGVHTTGLHKNDNEPHVQNVIEGIESGAFGDIQPYVPQEQPALVTIDQIKSSAKKHIDATAERVRLKYISNGTGQSLIYQAKTEEAVDFVAAGYPEDQLSDYPFIEAEAEIQGITGQEAADQIINIAAVWRQKGVAIEKVRRSGKIQIDQQTDLQGIETITQSIVEELNNL